MTEELILEEYQEKGIKNIALELTKHRNVLAVSPTGSGKGIMIATIISRFLSNEKKNNRNSKAVVIVHKDELANDIRNRIWKYFGIFSQKIESSTKRIEEVDVYIIMVETFDRRSNSQNFLDKFKEVRLAIFDEAHLGNHRKLFMHFIEAKRIGFTATPISAVKKYPLNKDYNSIVIIATIKEMIELNKKNPMRGCVPWIPYAIDKNVDYKEIEKMNFDEDLMGEKFSGKTQIGNTLRNYTDHAYGKKTLCFCANVKSSKLMCEAFVEAGFNARHIDGSATKAYREEIFGTPQKKGWIELYPDAILCNVGIATIGTDIPSVECIILNSSIGSYTFLLQKLGRGGRPYRYPNGEYKKGFIMLDMGDNFDGGKMPWYDFPVDWKELFENPRLPKPGASPIKYCPECKGMNYASARFCQCLKIDVLTDTEVECGFEFPIESKEEDLVPRGMRKMIQEINVQECINFFKNTEYKERKSFYEIIKQICNSAWTQRERDYLEKPELQFIVDMVKKKTNEWNKIMKKGRWASYQEDLRANIINYLKSSGFDISIEEYESLLSEVEIEKQPVTI